MDNNNSPFKFLDPYGYDDINVFFGREKEVEALYNAISGVKHLLVYGASGAGKTSLVECGLRNQFSAADWFALTIRKGENINSSVFKAINQELSDPWPLDSSGFPDDKQVTFGQAVEALFDNKYQPLYLLFDQFEELLLLGQEEEKKEFFQRLNLLIRRRVPCHVILIMREEFIGLLSEYEKYCPSILQHRFHLEKMGRDNMRQAIQQILDSPQYRSYFTIQDSASVTHAILDKMPKDQWGIELSHMQVFLDLLWKRACKHASNCKYPVPVIQSSLVNEEDQLPKILSHFLLHQLEDLNSIYDKDMALEVLSSMISEQNTKLRLSLISLKKELKDKGIISHASVEEILSSLEQRRIIRSLRIEGLIQYEISHDTLALVVGQNLSEEIQLRERARRIYSMYSERKGYLNQDDIDHLRPYKRYLRYPDSLNKLVEDSQQYLDNKLKKDTNRNKERIQDLHRQSKLIADAKAKEQYERGLNKLILKTIKYEVTPSILAVTQSIEELIQIEFNKDKLASLEGIHSHTKKADESLTNILDLMRNLNKASSKEVSNEKVMIYTVIESIKARFLGKIQKAGGSFKVHIDRNIPSKVLTTGRQYYLEEALFLLMGYLLKLIGYNDTIYFAVNIFYKTKQAFDLKFSIFDINGVLSKNTQIVIDDFLSNKRRDYNLISNDITIDLILCKELVTLLDGRLYRFNSKLGHNCFCIEIMGGKESSSF